MCLAVKCLAGIYELMIVFHAHISYSYYEVYDAVKGCAANNDL